MILLVHHGATVGPEIDPLRPLSERGRGAVLLLADEAARRGVKPDVIWHSGKLRARQTAEAFWRACNPFASMSAERHLQPDDPPAWIRDRLIAETRHIIIVGHMPHLPRLLHLMLGGGREEGAITFPPHGMVALDAEGEGWRELWRSG